MNILELPPPQFSLGWIVFIEGEYLEEYEVETRIHEFCSTKLVNHLISIYDEKQFNVVYWTSHEVNKIMKTQLWWPIRFGGIIRTTG
jgi:hypothetical protein